MIIKNEWDLKPGDIFEARITAAADYDLYAEPADWDENDKD